MMESDTPAGSSLYSEPAPPVPLRMDELIQGFLELTGKASYCVKTNLSFTSSNQLSDEPGYEAVGIDVPQPSGQ